MVRPGDVVGDRFELEAVAGRGGMGEVFRARDRRTSALVALKVLRNEEKTPIERFAREARMLASLRHPAIVAYVDHGTTDGARWIAMEWLDGEPLSARLARGPLSTSEARAVVERVAEALAVAHPLGIVHRDIKPSNIFLVAGDLDRAKVLDFGVARPLGDALVTATGVLVGTPAYMAPEQARRGRDVDARSDVFSLGCVLFACLVGRSPFLAPDVMTVLMKVMLEEPPPIASLRSDVSPGLDDLLKRMLAKAPDARPRDAEAVLEALRAIDLDARPPSSVIGRREERVAIRVIGVRSLTDEPTHREGDPTVIVEHVGLAIEDHGAAFEAHPDGTFIATMRPGPDAAVRAVRCALSIRAALGDIPLHVTPFELVRGKGITIDPVLTGLVEHRFELEGTRVIRERAVEAPRAPRGTLTPFVGRERELALLRALFDDSIHNQTPVAVLITGPPGIGKTRLAREVGDSVVVVEGAELPTVEHGMAIAIARESSGRPGVEHIRLGPLPRRAATKIADYDTGNPLYLEEIARHGSSPLPLSIVIVEQSRLEALEADARRVLRAASTLDEPFSREDLLRLAGGAVETWLDVLIARSLLEQRADGYRFTDAIVREATRRMLTDTDRALAAQAMRP
jgi:eukaryotic-like serine/threonine-protein kinase